MRKPLADLQDLRRRIYAKAKAEKQWRFWGLYVHVCKMETLQAAYKLAKANNGAPGIDGVTFGQIEAQGVEGFLKQVQEELLTRTYRPMRNRKKEIPKDGNKVRVLGIPTIRDRVVQGALKLILEPIFESDFHDGSFGYRPKRSAHQAVARVASAIVRGKTRVIDVDLKGFFDNVAHDVLLTKIARRVRDPEILRLVRMMLKASGRRGVPQGGVASPLFSNIYLNEVDQMLEKAQQVTHGRGDYTAITYARYADDLVVLVSGLAHHGWLLNAANRRLREEIAKIQVELNEEKSRVVDLAKGESFGFLGFEFRRMRSRRGVWRPNYTPRLKKRTALLQKLADIFRRFRSQPVRRVIELINPIVRGWVQYFRFGHSNRCFGYVRSWVEKKVRRHMARARQRPGFGWNRWSRGLLYGNLGLFNDYKIRSLESLKALP